MLFRSGSKGLSKAKVLMTSHIVVHIFHGYLMYIYHEGALKLFYYLNTLLLSCLYLIFDFGSIFILIYVSLK